MDGIEKITGRIAADIEQEIADISAEAAARAQGITSNYKAQAQRESEEILTRGRKNADERLERLASVAQLEARKVELAAKQELIETAFQQAQEKLANLPEDEYVALLAALAAKSARTGKERVILSQKDRTKVGKQAVTAANQTLGERGNLTLAEESRAIAGGLILSDGDVEMNSTFETLLRLQRGELSREVARVLFEEGA